MRFSYAESMCDPAHDLPLAQATDLLRRYADTVIVRVGKEA